MAFNTYTITLTNGTVLAYVNPQTVDDASSALTLIGQADLGYGVYLNENLVHLLENFSNASPPTNAGGPLQGQLWFDSGNNLLKYYDTGSTWQPIASQAWVEANFTSSGSSGLFATESWVEAYVSAQDFITVAYLNAQGYLTSNQTITLTGDVTGSGTTSITTSLSPNGMTAGTYEKVIVDATGRVTVGEQLNQADIITALGYTPAAVGSGPGQTLYSYGALGTSASTVLNYLGFESTNTNTNLLQLSEYRFANGSNWTTATTRIQNITDITSQGYIDFNPQNHAGGLALGAENVMQLVCQNVGGDSGVYINNKLNIVGSSVSDPVLWMETGTLNSGNTGFATKSKLGLISYSQLYGALYFSSNSDGSNNVAILPDGSVNTLGINGRSSGVYMQSNGANYLSLDGSGSMFLKPGGTPVFVVDSAGDMTSYGTMTNKNGNWYSNTNSNTNFWVNNAAGTNLGVLWFDNTNSPHAWRMIANPGGGGGPNQFAFDANGNLSAGAIYTDANGDSGTGMLNFAGTNLSLTVQGQRRIVIGGFYDFEKSGGAGYVSIPGDINLYFGEGNMGDGNATDTNGARRRLSLQSDGNMVVYALDDAALWASDTATSDVRLKRNVETYTGGLEFINQLRPVTFQWKEGNVLYKKHGDEVQVGFIAQELEEIDGHGAVMKIGPKESRIVHKQAFVPHLVSAVQELATENAYLKLNVEKLESKINVLEQKASVAQKLENRIKVLENIIRQKLK